MARVERVRRQRNVALERKKGGLMTRNTSLHKIYGKKPTECFLLPHPEGRVPKAFQVNKQLWGIHPLCKECKNLCEQANVPNLTFTCFDFKKGFKPNRNPKEALKTLEIILSEDDCEAI